MSTALNTPGALNTFTLCGSVQLLGQNEANLHLWPPDFAGELLLECLAMPLMSDCTPLASRMLPPCALSRCVPLSRYIAASRRGSASLPSDEQFPICTRDSFGALYAFLGSACLGTHRIPCARARRGAFGERGFGGFVQTRLRALTRAREGPRVRSFQWTLISSIAVGTTNTRPDLLEFAPAGGAVSIPRRERIRARMGRVAACEAVRCVRDVSRTRVVHPAAVRARVSLFFNASLHPAALASTI
ncbi:hypothetical protein FB451DRAFT_1408012 [Mycena latifolia]|nr:hypothetical protein FB451DRAFT_1408012 [Mycena latifolia]